ncbi:MAG TPA: transcriptional repressor [Candidatus Competibacteraceae bacterium]|nr:transcriptional repressor [Candidatus Competibacteraceae bacterium]
MNTSANLDPAQGERIQQRLAGAERLCQSRGHRFTALRRRVLEIILESDRPLGAYAILDVLRERDGRRGAPPTVYRALDFLLEQGLVHRLASLNVYAVCDHPEQRHAGQFLICAMCGRVRELDSQVLEQTIRAEAAARHFTVGSQVVEVLGRCADCQATVNARGH